jgi:ABC-type uncharacterized transport system ATPase subunit
LRDFQNKNSKEASAMLERLCQAVIKNENVFAVLMDAVRVRSLGQITHVLFEVGSQYGRNMQATLVALHHGFLRSGANLIRRTIAKRLSRA